MSWFADIVHDIFGGSQREAAPSQATSVSLSTTSILVPTGSLEMDLRGYKRGELWNKRRHAQRNAHWAHFELQVTDDRPSQSYHARAPSVEEVPAPAASRSGKRDRGGDEVSPAQGSKSSRSSESASNLVPNYQRRPPQNSTQIAVPTYESWKDWKLGSSKQAHTMGAPYRLQGGVKPLNTLGRSSHQIARPKQPQRKEAPQFSDYGSKQPRLDVTKSKGSNVPSSPGFVDLSESQQPPVKRRRVDQNPQSNPVDLTSDDEPKRASLDWTQGRAIPAKHAGTSVASQKSATELSNKTKKRQSQDLFGNDEMSHADVGLSHNFTGAQKRSKRGRGGWRSTSPNESRQGHNGQNSGTAQKPVVLDVDDDSISAQDTGFNGSGRAEPLRVTGTLLMDLGRGLKEAGEEHRRKQHKSSQGSAADMSQVNDVMESAGYRKPRPTQKQAHSQPLGPGRRTISQSGRLSERFVRDGPDNAVKNIEDDDAVVVGEHARNARGKVQQSSSRPRATDQSPDELTGARTVLSGKSRSASPTKGIPVVSRSENALNGVLATRVSASQLQPNQFTRASKSAVSRVKDPEVDIWTLDDEQDLNTQAGERISIDAIICKGYYAINGGHILVWDASHNSYFLADGSGKIVYSPLQREPIMLGALAVAHKIRYSDKSLKVILGGSANWMSTGDILIEFADRNGMRLFYNALCDNEGTRTLAVKLEVLEATFEKMRDHQVARHMNAVRQSQEQAQLQQDRAHIDEDEERIIYEDERPPRETALSRMTNGGTLSEVLLHGKEHPKQQQGETTSRHFPPEPPRRSNRQPVPTVKSRDPSPEPVKWTEQNGIPKWAKPVIFPEQGVRQVTIDAKDLTHLDAGELLNDNIVNYALREIEEKLPPRQKDRFHFFNTFFFSSLTTKNGKRAFNYEAVKKWTKKVDLFTKEFVVVPINLDLHWFVIIIHNLPSLARVPLDDQVERLAGDAVNIAPEHGSTPLHSDGPQSRLAQMNLSDAAEPTAEEAIFERMKLLDEEDEDSKGNVKSTKGKKKKPVPPVRKFLANQPRVVCLDSFGVKRTSEVRTIKDYIIAEAGDKRKMDVTKEQLQGINASGIPQQNNFYDCGVYLIGYMKEFAKDPDRFLERVLGREMTANDFVAFDTTALRDEVRKDLVSYGSAANEKYRKDKLAKRMARNDAGKTSNKSHSSQSLRSSPAAPNLAPVATSTNAVRGSPELPTSNTFPGSPYEALGPTKDGDELELGIPHPLQVSNSNQACREPSHRASPSDVVNADDEMLDSADAPEIESHDSAYRPATPHPREAASGHNSNLSPLSSLSMDSRWASGLPAASASDARATVSEGGPQNVKIREDDEIKEEGKIKHEVGTTPTVTAKDEERNAPDITDEPGIVHSDHDRLTGPYCHDQQEWYGLDDKDADRSVEIPDSQPEI